MVWPTSCDGVAIGQGMVGRNCGQVNRSTPEERKALGRCFASAGQVDAENARSTLLTNGKVLLAGGENLGRALGTLAVERLVDGWSVLPFSQQCRFLNNIDGAIQHLSRAAELKRDPSIFLALGIAFQLLNTQSDKAIMAFRRAIEIDSDYELAYNSLALTQRTSGELDKALYNYDAGAKALARRIVKAMRNSRSNPILKIAKRLGNYGSNMQAMPRCIWVAVQKASKALLG